jgi:PAS domain S-box-containing protein
MDKLLSLLEQLAAVNHDLEKSGVDALLTEQGPLLIGDARFSVPFSEARYRSLIDRLDVLVLEMTASGEIVYSNEATSRITGMSNQQLLSSTCIDIIKPLNSSLSIERLCNEFLENIELIDYQTSLVTADGSYKVISWHTFDIFNNEHQLDRIVYFGIDISKDLLAEQDLAIASIAFNTNLAMTIYDVEGTILKINTAYTELTGYTTTDVLGKNYQQLASAHNSVDFYTEKRQTIKDKGAWSGELWSTCKKGEDYQEFRTINAVRSKEGLITHLVSTHKDISQAKLVEDKLSIATVAFEVAQPMFITDAQGLFTHINSAFTEATYYSIDELTGKNPNILNSGLQDSEFYKAMWQDINTHGRWSGELWNKRKDGEVYFVQLSITEVSDTDGNRTHYVCSCTDITQRKAHEEGLIEAKEKAERFSTLKSEFMATMSHEIRTPMNAIIGFSMLALYEDMSPEVRSYVEDINTASTSLLGILQDVLDFTKLEVGRVVIESIPLDLLDLFGTINTLFIGAAQQKDLEFTIIRDGAIPLNLLGDKLRLQQVLINLVGNAIKFTLHGSVKLEISLHSISLTQACLLFSVSDTGIGIAPEDQSKLFLAFSQVDGSHSRRFGGTGLGLAISKDLVELMGGEIVVDSHSGLGSTFSFILPFEINHTAINHSTHSIGVKQDVTNRPGENKFKGQRVLIVEDNGLSQKLTLKHMNFLGIDAKIASNGEEALSLLEQYEFDAVLMDIHMPIMNGIEATTHIRQQEKWANLPIIALSAGVSEMERNNCIACGIVGFIAKPIDVEQLYATLVLWLKSSVELTDL